MVFSGKLTVFAFLYFISEELLYFFSELLFDTEGDGDDGHDGEDGDQPQPEGLLYHTLRQRLVGDPRHALLTALAW